MKIALLSLAIIVIITMESDSIMPSLKNKFNSIPDWDHLFKKEAVKFGLDWKMLKAICMVESNLGRAPSVARGLKNPKDLEASKSTDGLSWGLMQIRPTTAKQFDFQATAEKLNNPEYAVRIAAQYFAWASIQLKKLGTSQVEYLVKSYNQGLQGTINEIAGGKGFADAYFEKFKAAYSVIKSEV